MTNLISQSDLQDVLSALGVQNISEREKPEVVKQLREHFNKVVLDTVVGELDEGQIDEFSRALDAEDAEEKIAAITARVPGLMKKIEDAVGMEIKVLRAAKDNLR